ncbi:VOC family protein [Vibrio sp. SCSIO 43136]|uniref:VOC family protein n=1 Tax=Vibrio sp. SCSIO 43136 TaxID=2819101 RepID=UPI002074FD56|nr:VOC family protein [Vibrio sp. SCSIO 43136]USD64035.1 VOC family protein [Vibrio sp. SCSIO 43136]
MEFNPVGWFEIYVDDMHRAQKFYEAVLDVSLEDLSDPAGGDLIMKAFPASMESYGATGALVKMADMPAGGNSTLVYFSCKDCATEESRIAAAGGEVLQSKFSIGQHGFIVIAQDSEGNTFGLHSS